MAVSSRTLRRQIRFLSSPGSLLKRRESACAFCEKLSGVGLAGGMKILFGLAAVITDEVVAGMEAGAVVCSEVFAAIVE